MSRSGHQKYINSKHNNNDLLDLEDNDFDDDFDDVDNTQSTGLFDQLAHHHKKIDNAKNTIKTVVRNVKKSVLKLEHHEPSDSPSALIETSVIKYGSKNDISKPLEYMNVLISRFQINVDEEKEIIQSSMDTIMDSSFKIQNVQSKLIYEQSQIITKQTEVFDKKIKKITKRSNTRENYQAVLRNHYNKVLRSGEEC